MHHTAARFPALTPPDAATPARAALDLSLIPLPMGEVSVLLTAWLLLLII